MLINELEEENDMKELFNLIDGLIQEDQISADSVIQVYGVEIMKRMQGMHYLMTPDSVINLSNSQVCKRQYESGSRVLGNFNATGTVIYLPKEYNGKPVDPNDPILGYDLNHNEVLAYENTEDFLQQLQLAAKPLKIQFWGSYEMILDTNHRVERFTISWLSFDISRTSL
eukprot:gene10181-11070_t